MNKVINNIKKYRYLLYELIKKDIKLKYRSSYLGIIWTLLEPLLTTVVLYLVFSRRLAKTEYFAVYILTGRLLYTYFSNASKSAMKSIRSNSSMIKKVYVPKYIYPFSTILSNYVMFIISLVVLVGAMIIYRVPVTWNTLLFFVPLILLLVLTMGVGLILSTMAVFFRDLEYLWNVVLMIVMYTTGIFYDAKDMLGEYAWALDFNPLYVVIALFRNVTIEGTTLDPYYLLLGSLYSFGSLLIGVFWFYKKQDKFILNI